MTTEPRDSLLMVVCLLEKIPESEKEFIEELTNFYKHRLFHLAPELRKCSRTWEPFCVIFNKYITNKDEAWKKECVDIFVGNARTS